MSFRSKIVRIFLPFTLGYFITSIFRTVNAVLAPSIERSTGMTSTELSIATSAYFFSFALFQLPTGIFVDWFGPRKVQTIMFFFAGAGSILYGFATGPILLTVARLMMGAGMAGGLLTAFAANRIWFSRKEFMMLNSLVYSLGSLGAIVASWPTYAVLQFLSWNWISIFFGIFACFCAIYIYAVVPSPETKTTKTSLQETLRGLKIIYTDRYFWKVTPLMISVYGCFMSLQSYWISPWLIRVNHVPESRVSIVLLFVGCAMILAPTFASYICHLFPRYKYRYDWTIWIGAFIAIIFQIIIASHLAPGNFLLWAGYTFFAVFAALIYSNLSAHFSVEFAGRSTTALNTLLFFGVFLLQYLFGFIARHSYPTIEQGMFLALWIYIALQSVSLVWYIFGKCSAHE